MSCRTLQIIPDVNYTLPLLSFPLLGSENCPTVANAAKATIKQPQVSTNLFNQKCLRAFGTNVGYAYMVVSTTWGAGSAAERIAGSHVI